MPQTNSVTMPMMATYPAARTPYGTCLWEFDGSAWTVKSVESQNGGIVGEPPRQPGRFKGQLRATPCITGA